MPELGAFGKVLILLGALLALIGALLVAAPKIPFLGKLPGDILIRRRGFSVCFPVVTCLLLSGILTLLFWLLRVFRK